jgi:hypothetical protein
MLQISLPPSEKSNALLVDAVMSLGWKNPQIRSQRRRVWKEPNGPARRFEAGGAAPRPLSGPPAKRLEAPRPRRPNHQKSSTSLHLPCVVASCDRACHRRAEANPQFASC